MKKLSLKYFFQGAGSVLDIFPTGFGRRRVSYENGSWEQDSSALAGDWGQMGEDFDYIIEELKSNVGGKE